MPNRSSRWSAGLLVFELFHASLSLALIRESSRMVSFVRHGTTLTCAESLSVYGPIVVVAFIHPDIEMYANDYDRDDPAALQGRTGTSGGCAC
jgi:hypothetical protein